MDAFYAAVEQRDFPQYRGKPVIVSGDPKGRGVVATASYEAREFGVHSAMSACKALELCPQGIFVYPRFSVYQKVSFEIRAIFSEYTRIIEPLSLDEAFLDVSDGKRGLEGALAMAREIKEKIFTRTGLSASAGVSYCKFLAKIASDMNKPNGLTLIGPEEATAFLDELPIGKFYGIGRVTEKKMRGLGVFKGADLKKWTLDEMLAFFGKNGGFYYHMVRGIDHRSVNPVRERKSIGKENTFAQDLSDPRGMWNYLVETAEELEEYCARKKIYAQTVTLKVRYGDFTSLTRSKKVPYALYRSRDILEVVRVLLQSTEVKKRPVRLLGISLSHLLDEKEASRKDAPMMSLF